MTYTVGYHDKPKKLFRITGPNPPPYFAKGCRGVGIELASLDIQESQIEYEVEDIDKYMIRAFIHASKVLSQVRGQKSRTLDAVVRPDSS